MSAQAIKHLSFLLPGTYPEDAPETGLEETLKLIELGERLGYDGAWVRQRHLENSISSASVILAAASQRTRTIDLGSAVIEMAYEDPFRLAEDLATVDLLAKGRLHVGVSAGSAALKPFIEPDRHDLTRDPVNSHDRIAKFVRNLEGHFLGNDADRIVSAGGKVRPRIRPVAPGIKKRLWYGAGSHRSVEWAAKNGFNLLIGNINVAETDEGFTNVQISTWSISRPYRQHAFKLEGHSTFNGPNQIVADVIKSSRTTVQSERARLKVHAALSLHRIS